MKKIILPKKPVKTTKSLAKKLERQFEELAKQQEYFNQFEMFVGEGIKW